MSLRHNYVLVINSKTAGTTLKAIAAELEREPLARRPVNGEDTPAQRTENWLRTPTLADIPASVLREVFLGGRFFRFTTVRHPIHRCWSAWIDKIVCRSGDFAQRFGREPWFIASVTSPTALIAGFVEFVDHLKDTPGLLGADRHWAPQHLVLQWGAFPYDFAGRTEDFVAVVNRWERATGLEITPIAKRLGRQNSRSLPLPASRIPEMTWRKLRLLYALDFEAFEYSSDQGDFDEGGSWESAADELVISRRRSAMVTHHHFAPWRALRVMSARSVRRSTARLGTIR